MATLSDPERITLLRRTQLLASFTDEELAPLAGLLREIVVTPGALILREGEPGAELFLIREGEVQVEKHGVEITRLGAGAVVGEVAMVDGGPRSASVRAVEQTRVYALSVDAIRDLGRRGNGGGSTDVAARLSHGLAERLRYTNEVTVAALRRQVAMGKLLTFLIFSLSIYAFVLETVQGIAATSSAGTLVSASLMLVLFGCALAFMRRLGYPLSFYGITTRGWRRALAEGVLFTVPVLAGIVALKWALIRLVPSLDGAPLFDPSAAVNVGPGVDPTGLLLLMAGIYTLHAPLQELIARGCLQSSLQHFLTGPSRLTVAIVGSNLIFSAFHLYISMGFAVATFLPGLFWGWLYARHGTLVGVSVSHVLIGLFAVFVLGVEAVLG